MNKKVTVIPILLVLLCSSLAFAAVPVINSGDIYSSSYTNTTTEALLWTLDITSDGGHKPIVEWINTDDTYNYTGRMFLFEYGSNSSWTQDFSSYSENATVVGATWAADSGVDGWGAYTFDGTDDYVNYTHLWQQNSHGKWPMSISCWISVDAYPPVSQSRALVTNADQNGAEGFAFFLATKANGDKMLTFRPVANDSNVFLSKKVTWLPGNWHHIMVTSAYDPSGTDKMNLIIDGTTVASSSTTFEFDTTRTDGYIGSNPLQGSGSFSGKLDDCQFFVTGLSGPSLLFLNSSTYPSAPNLGSTETDLGQTWNYKAYASDDEGISAMFQSDDLTIISAPAAPSAPEFSTITMLLAFGIISGGLIAMRKRE